MGFKSPVQYDRSSVGVEISYTNPLLGVKPISLVEGNSDQNVMSINDPGDFIKLSRTATGDVNAVMKSIIVSGTLSLHPKSPAVKAIGDLQNKMALLGIVIPGQVVVKAPQISYTFKNFTFSSPFVGVGISDEFDDYEYPFECTPPTDLNFQNLIDVTAGLIDIV
ncbi:hypothetical protein [Francisella tularensis]|uniref:hypothetical protein n=1 Tax=Francisella tularensis TaxID=263 RepID=UPI0008F4FBFE|nr:hypothetical protein [Francisella tularensis]APA83236.1 hypothetical protein N894_1252 [Francisella tularensis subsp. novicida PA10-7858]